ncbi:MAG: tetratricopeptide repeat protein [Planctomycetes bacterium]|nr:tetratricopeptide repeat protein [Planctomycetota bacterium]
MRKLVPTLSLVILLLLTASQRTIDAQDKPVLRGIKACNAALDLLEAGKPAEALEVMEAAKGTLDAEDEWLWWGNTGHCYRDLRQDDKALEHYEKAVKLQPDCWFRFSYCRLLHEYGRWDEALVELDKEIDREYAESVRAMKAVINGPFKERWPLTHKKLELKSKRGNYLVVSDVGVTPEEMDALEAEAATYDLTSKPDQRRLEKLLKPHDDLVSLANLAELSRDEYMRFTGAKSKSIPKGKISKVFFFTNESDFHSYAMDCGGDGDTENTLGFYDPTLKYLQLYSQPGAKSQVCGLARDTIDTFFHEGWHQFFDMITEQTPVWFDEGLAEFVGYADVKNKGAKIELGLLVRVRGEHYTRYERIRECITEGSYIPFSKFFRFTSRDWNSGDVNIHYAQAWSIAYFALQGTDSGFRKDYSKLFWELSKGRPVDEIVDELFPEDKLKRYEEAWLKYWKTT